ncbi:MAG: 4Fe-4S binding protein [Clostridium sp.]|nr:4Fe-4S binding protein [Clostridium sp.]
MKMNELRAVVSPCSATPLVFDESKCIGCNSCADICQCDIMLPNPEKGKHPIVMYPGECWYCGACVMVCPVPGAIDIQHPVMNRAKFVPVKPEPRPVSNTLNREVQEHE